MPQNLDLHMVSQEIHSDQELSLLEPIKKEVNLSLNSENDSLPLVSPKKNNRRKTSQAASSLNEETCTEATQKLKEENVMLDDNTQEADLNNDLNTNKKIAKKSNHTVNTTENIQESVKSIVTDSETENIHKIENAYVKAKKIKQPNLKADMNNPNNPHYKKNISPVTQQVKEDFPTNKQIHSKKQSSHLKSQRAYKQSHTLKDEEVVFNDSSNNVIDAMNNNSAVNSNKANTLIYYLRQKSGTHSSLFWTELDLALQNTDFLKITENNMSLVSYAVLYGKEDIFSELLKRYGSLISKEEFENNIFSYCMNKNPIFIKQALECYTHLYKPSSEFIDLLIEKSAKSSYRLENNQEIMKWLEGNMLKKHHQKFWDCCINERNIVLFEHALHYKKTHTFLMKNADNYKEKIKLLGKEHTVAKSFENPVYFNKDESLDEHITYDSVDIEKKLENLLVNNNLGLPKEQVKNIQKELYKPEIVIKKKKKF